MAIILSSVDHSGATAGKISGVSGQYGRPPGENRNADMVVSVGHNLRAPQGGPTSPSGRSPRSELVFPRATTINVEDLGKGVPFLPQENGEQMPCGRRFIFLLFEHPTTVVSKWISLFVFFLILLSSVSGFVESIPVFRYPNLNLKTEDDSSPSFKLINDVCMVLFVIEFMARFTTAHACKMVEDMELDKHIYLPYEETAGGFYRTWAWFNQPLSLIDFFAILPFAFQVIPGLEDNVQQAVALRYFRLIRVFRVMKLQKQTISVSLFLNTIRKSSGPLSVLIFFLGMCIVVFGSICFNLERGTWIPFNPGLAGGCSNGTDSSSAHCCGGDLGKPSHLAGCWMRDDFYADNLEKTPFTSVFMSMWWVLTTVTTVGYGDMFPTSTAGRVIGSGAMIMGVIGFAMPITIIGTTFSEEYESLTTGQDGGTGPGVLDSVFLGIDSEPDFIKYDTNNSGGLDLNEFKTAFYQKYKWESNFSEVIFRQLFKRDGKAVGRQEFAKLCGMLNTMRELFDERFEDLDAEFVIQMLEPAGLSTKKDTDEDQQIRNNFGPITVISDDQPGSLDVASRVAPMPASSPNAEYQNAAPTPAPALEAPTPSRCHHERSVAYLDNYIHHRPPDYPYQLDFSSQSAQQLSTLQLLISQELCRRLGSEKASQRL